MVSGRGGLERGMRQQESILEYHGGVYLKLAVLLCVAAVAVYAVHEIPAIYPKPYGGTWLGYTLGGVGAFLILWLMVLGVRKRRYASSMGTVEGWTSAHVYLGIALIIIVTLHSGFEFGWNVHTLAYALMVLVIASGIFGVYTYLHYPALITENLGGDTMEATLLKIADLDRRCRRLALDLPDEANALVVKSTRANVRQAQFRSGLRRRLRGDAVRCPTREAARRLVVLGARYTGKQAAVTAQLVAAMTRKSALVDKVRRELRYRALMEVWLYAHVPLSFALLAALIAHVVSVFYFW
jgi:hypothetical protein